MWRHGSLEGPERYLDDMLPHQILAHHIAVAAMPPESLAQPVFETPELAPAPSNRCPMWIRKDPLSIAIVNFGTANANTYKLSERTDRLSNHVNVDTGACITENLKFNTKS